MKRVFSSKDRAAVEIVRRLLLDEGIETTVFNETTSAVLGDVPFFHAEPEVFVLRDEDAAQARVIVEQFVSGQAKDALPTEAWDCPTCGETIDGQFTECWNCHEADSG